MEQWEPPLPVGGNAEWDCHFGTVLQFLTKLNTLLSYNLTAPFLGIYPDELKTYVHTKLPKLENKQEALQKMNK